MFFVGHGPFVDIRVAEKNAYRTVFTPRKDPLCVAEKNACRTAFTPRKDPLRPTPRKDPLRPPAVLAADGSREASGASPRKRLNGQLCSRPLKPALLSPRKLVRSGQCLTLNQEGSGRRRPRRRGAAYFQLTAPLSRAPLCVLGDRYSEFEKSPAVAAPPTSSVPPPGSEHHYVCSETGAASTR